MKKDKKWFVDKWTEERDKSAVHDPMYHFINEFITDVKELDEPEVLSQKWIEKHTWNNHYIGKPFVYVEDLQNLIVPKQEELESKIKVLIEAYKQEEDAYSNPENGWISGFIEDLKNLVEEEQKLQVSLYEENINIVLDDLKEYIKEQQSLSQNVGLAHTSSGNDTHYRQYDYVLECINEYESSDELRNLLVSKQELPVVPAWFDEWWKDVSKGPGSLLHNIDRFCDELFSSGTREMYNYISTPDNKKKLLNIIINELDYKVEEEHKYYALIKGHELITGEGIWDCRYWNLSTSDGVVFPSNRFSRDDKLLTKMSKEDWGKCGINESNADFVKVGEVK